MANTGTVIIAHRRRGKDYWEGYTEKPATHEKEELAYYRGIGHIARSFPSISAFRDNCNNILDRLEAKRKPL
jgi:hypothetical protein